MKIQFIKTISLVLMVISITACVSPLPLEQQLTETNYQVKKPILIAVVDKRKRLSSAKEIQEYKDATSASDAYDSEEDAAYIHIRTPYFVGKVHGVYGIPSDWEVKHISLRKEDKDKTLAELLQERITKGLTKNNWNVQLVNLNNPTENEARQLLAKSNASKLVVLVLNEWFFSINLNWISAFNFDTDVNVFVYSKNTDKAFSKQIKERDVVDEKASDSFQNMILAAYKAQLDQIFNDLELKDALLNN